MSKTSKFVKELASDKRSTRDAAFESLSKYLRSRSTAQLSLLEMEKLWKGLYYTMWLCDRPRPQEQLAESLGSLYSEVVPSNCLPNFLEAFWVVIVREWHSIDYWRVDKYYLLIRRVLRHNFKKLKSQNWPLKDIDDFLTVYEKLPLSGKSTISTALPYHLCDIYLDELERVIFEDISEDEEEEGDDEQENKRLESVISEKKKDILRQVPVGKLIVPFEKLEKSDALKPLKNKIKEEGLSDPRLVEWGVFQAEEDKDGNEDEGEDEEEEWHGFD